MSNKKIDIPIIPLNNKFTITFNTSDELTINKDKLPYIVGKYFIIGHYNLVTGFWLWSYNNQYIENNLKKESKKIHEYHKELLKTTNIKDFREYEHDIYYSQETFYVDHKDIINVLNLASKKLKGKFIIIDNRNNQSNTFIMISDILTQN